MKKITLNTSIFILVVVGLAFLVTNCKSSKNTATNTNPSGTFSSGEVEVPKFCSITDHPSTVESIHAASMGESSDMTMSQKVAKSNTLEELASKIEVVVMSVVDNYNSRRQVDMDETVEKRYEELIRTVVKQKISGYSTVCDKTTKTEEGTYRTYLIYELPIDNILNPFYKEISRDDELKVDYDYQKFKETFDEEMKKMENQ